MKKYFWIALIAFVVIIQFISSKRPETIENESGDLLTVENVPEDVAALIRTSCYDCHSNQTHYPFYAYVAPVTWLVVRDVKKGREELNLSDWGTLEKAKKANVLSDIIDEVEDEEMPMAIYTAIHRNARLDSMERQQIIDWANQLGISLFE